MYFGICGWDRWAPTWTLLGLTSVSTHVQILSLWIALFVSKIDSHVIFMVTHRHVRVVRNLSCLTLTFLVEFEQGNLGLLVLASECKCPFWIYSMPRFSHVWAFCWWFCCLQWVPSIVPSRENACLEKLHSGVGYSVVGLVLNVMN